MLCKRLFPLRCGLTGPRYRVGKLIIGMALQIGAICLAPCRIFRWDIRVCMGTVHLRHASPRLTPSPGSVPGSGGESAAHVGLNEIRSEASKPSLA